MKKFLKPGLILLAILGVFLALEFTGAGDFLKDVVQKIEGLGVWGPILFVVIYILSALFLIPASAITLGAGLAFGLWKGFIYTSVASTLAAAAAFLAGRYLFRKKVEKKIADDENFSAIYAAVEEEGWKTVALSRFSPVFPYTFLNYAFGLTKVRFWPFVLSSWIAMMPGTFLYVYLGALGNEASGGGSTAKTIFLVVGLIATVVVTVLITKTAKRKLNEQLESADDEHGSSASGKDSADAQTTIENVKSGAVQGRMANEIHKEKA